ncbi:MAG: hypothetical protein LBT30_04905 [Clostridiales bacterium]|jgi:hypothetical protein|nr:hypothetical protein [Clostridiales bacterium]
MKALASVLTVLFAVIFGLFGTAWVYVYFFINTPETGLYSYVHTLTDQNGDAKYFLELNHYAAVGGGDEMTELIFNYYTDYNMVGVKSYGIQQINGEFYYYDGFDGTYVSIPAKEPGFKMIVDVKSEADIENGVLHGTPYAVVLDGTYVETQSTVNLIKPLENVLKTGFGIIGDLFRKKEDRNAWKYDNNGENIWSTPITDVDYITKSYTFEQFFEMAKMYLTRSSYGYGDYVLPLVELQSYFSLEVFEDGQFKPLQDATFNMSYFSVDVKNYRYGASFAPQSVFGMIGYDPNYNSTGMEINDEYWKYVVDYTLTARDFDYVYSSVYGGYLLIVNPLRLAELSEYKGLNLHIRLDLEDVYLIDYGYNVVGVASYGLFGLRLDSFTVLNGSGQDFNLLSYSLWDTGLKSFSAVGSNVVKASDCFNGAGGVL